MSSDDDEDEYERAADVSITSSESAESLICEHGDQEMQDE